VKRKGEEAENHGCRDATARPFLKSTQREGGRRRKGSRGSEIKGSEGPRFPAREEEEEDPPKKKKKRNNFQGFQSQNNFFFVFRMSQRARAIARAPLASRTRERRKRAELCVIQFQGLCFFFLGIRASAGLEKSVMGGKVGGSMHAGFQYRAFFARKIWVRWVGHVLAVFKVKLNGIWALQFCFG
jgi:hypothetical protein